MSREMTSRRRLFYPEVFHPLGADIRVHSNTSIHFFVKLERESRVVRRCGKETASTHPSSLCRSVAGGRMRNCCRKVRCPECEKDANNERGNEGWRMADDDPFLVCATTAIDPRRRQSRQHHRVPQRRRPGESDYLPSRGEKRIAREHQKLFLINRHYAQDVVPS